MKWRINVFLAKTAGVYPMKRKVSKSMKMAFVLMILGMLMKRNLYPWRVNEWFLTKIPRGYLMQKVEKQWNVELVFKKEILCPCMQNSGFLTKTARGYPTKIAGRSWMPNCVQEGKIKGWKISPRSPFLCFWSLKLFRISILQSVLNRLTFLSFGLRFGEFRDSGPLTRAYVLCKFVYWMKIIISI